MKCRDYSRRRKEQNIDFLKKNDTLKIGGGMFGPEPFGKGKVDIFGVYRCERAKAFLDKFQESQARQPHERFIFWGWKIPRPFKLLPVPRAEVIQIIRELNFATDPADAETFLNRVENLYALTFKAVGEDDDWFTLVQSPGSEGSYYKLLRPAPSLL